VLENYNRPRWPQLPDVQKYYRYTSPYRLISNVLDQFEFEYQDVSRSSYQLNYYFSVRELYSGWDILGMNDKIDDTYRGIYMHQENQEEFLPFGEDVVSPYIDDICAVESYVVMYSEEVAEIIATEEIAFSDNIGKTENDFDRQKNFFMHLSRKYDKEIVSYVYDWYDAVFGLEGSPKQFSIITSKIEVDEYCLHGFYWDCSFWFDLPISLNFENAIEYLCQAVGGYFKRFVPISIFEVVVSVIDISIVLEMFTHYPQPSRVLLYPPVSFVDINNDYDSNSYSFSYYHCVLAKLIWEFSIKTRKKFRLRDCFAMFYHSETKDISVCVMYLVNAGLVCKTNHEFCFVQRMKLVNRCIDNCFLGIIGKSLFDQRVMCGQYFMTRVDLDILDRYRPDNGSSIYMSKNDYHQFVSDYYGLFYVFSNHKFKSHVLCVFGENCVIDKYCVSILGFIACCRNQNSSIVRCIITFSDLCLVLGLHTIKV